MKDCIKTTLIFIIVVIHTATCSEVYPFFGLITPFYTEIRNHATNWFANEKEYKRLLDEQDKLGKLQWPISNSTPFFCDVNGPGRRSKTPPTSVHELRPGDIDIVATIGDSGSGGTGILFTNITGLVVENRGITFTAGGDGTWRQFLTIPNILKEYNPNLYGYSQGSGPPYWTNSGLNAAEALVLSEHAMHQIKFIYNRMKSNPNVDMEKHWKLITIFVGNNDLCATTCLIANYGRNIERHKNDIINVLRFIRDKIPRTLVNYISLTNMNEFFHLESPYSCEIVNFLECPCRIHVKLRKSLTKMYNKFIKKWIKVDVEVISRAEFHEKDDFDVVMQPFMRDIKIPKLPNGKTDMQYMAFDCFHFSQRGHALAAKMLWNNLLQPIGKKELKWTPGYSDFECPTEKRPYFATTKNSGI